jgi:hypothetical protein
MNELQPTAEINPPARMLPLWRFSLSELMVFMTVAAVNFTCWSLHPVLGGFVTVVMLPAAVYTHLVNRVASEQGNPISFQAQILHFVLSCCLFFVGIYFCAAIAFGVAILGGSLIVLFGIRSIEMLVVVAVVDLLITILLMRRVCRTLKNNWPW